MMKRSLFINYRQQFRRKTL